MSGGENIAVLHTVVREVPTDEVTFEQLTLGDIGEEWFRQKEWQVPGA